MSRASRRTDALIRDIAQLFVDYRYEAWQPILEELSRGGQAQVRLAKAIEEALDKVSATKATAGGRRKAKPTARPSSPKSKAVPMFSSSRAETLTALQQALEERRIALTMSNLRQVYLASGGKDDLPKTRKAAVQSLLLHMDKLPDPTFEATIEKLTAGADGDASETYARWFKLIRPEN